MVLKDYYTTLRVNRHATGDDIKRSYRRLAMKYHPDKNQGDALAGAVFTEISEAYKVLSDSAARRAYDASHAGLINSLFANRAATTKVDVINGIAKLQKTVAGLNTLRLNQDALVFQVTQLLSPLNLQLLKDISTTERRVVTEQLLNCCLPLTYANAKKLSGLLRALAGDDETARSDIDQFLHSRLRQSRWDDYKIWIALALAVVLCLVMFLLNR